MELEEMQKAWSQMSRQLEKQKQLTNDIIMEMTQDKYKQQWGKIANYEKIGTLICFGMAIYILLNFNKLSSTPLIICGIISLLVLIILPIISLRLIQNMQNLDILNLNYTGAIEIYAKRKKNFIKFQKINVYVSFILMLPAAAVFGKLFKGKDIFEPFNLKLLFIIPGAILMMILFVKFVSKYYGNIINRADSILRDIQEL